MKLLPLLCLLLANCVIGDQDSDEDDWGDGEETGSVDSLAASALVPGVNGSKCVASPYNCKFHAAGSRVMTAGGSDSWAVETGASVRDGNGTALSTQKSGHMTFNYGQTRFLAGKAHALALSTSNGSAGWYPIDHIKGEASFRAHNGEVNAKDPGAGPMACYEIKNTHDASIELKKVVHDSTASHERAGDYLPLVRSGNGLRSANLVFSVPGFGLGGATTDHFLAGTKFQRVSVPTSTGKPSITIPLWVKASDGRYTKHSGDMRFFYGFIRASDGAKRFGWMAEDALQVSTGC